MKPPPDRKALPDTQSEPQPERTSWLVLLTFTPALCMFYGGGVTAVDASGWLALDRIGLGLVVLAGTILGLPLLLGEDGGALLRWEERLLPVQGRMMTWAGQTALRVLRWSLVTAALIALVVVDAAIGHWSGGALGGKSFFTALLVAFVLLILVSFLGFGVWLLSRRPKVNGILFKDLFEIGFKQPRRDVTIGVAILVFLLGSVLQYIAVGHAG